MTRIVGYGHAFPSHAVTNNDLSKKLDTSDEWIYSRTGIKQRYIASSDETVATLGFQASLQALTKACIAPEQINMIIVATTTPDNSMPATATKIQALLGCTQAFAFDVQAVCSGFLYALSIAHQFIKNGTVQKVLVIGADIMSRILDWTDRSTCVLFGDGAGALLLQADEEEDILSIRLYSDGTQYDNLYVDNSQPSPYYRGFLKMNGRAVFSAALEKMEESSRIVLKESQLSAQDLDGFVAHQANKRIIDAVAQRLQIPESKVILSIDQFANTSAATIPSTLSWAATQCRLQYGHRILLTAIGGGFTWGASVIQWGVKE